METVIYPQKKNGETGFNLNLRFNGHDEGFQSASQITTGEPRKI
jgi:hypothetical protein